MEEDEDEWLRENEEAMRAMEEMEHEMGREKGGREKIWRNMMREDGPSF